MASASVFPCDVSTSTWRSLETISYGLWRFLLIEFSSSRAQYPYFRENHFSGGRPAWQTAMS